MGNTVLLIVYTSSLIIKNCRSRLSAVVGKMVDHCAEVFVFCLFDLILYVPSTIFQLNRDRSSWVEPVLS